MTFRGVYRDGVVILDDDTGLRNGTPVEVSPQRNGRKGAASKPRTAKTSGERKSRAKKSAATNPLLALAGIWKDRAEWKGLSTLEIHKLLRARAMGGSY